jgi:hypothetical protein
VKEDCNGSIHNRAQPAEKGKKQESISEVAHSQPSSKRRLVLGPSDNQPASSVIPSALGIHVCLILEEPMSVGDILFNPQLSELEFGELELEDCKSFSYVKIDKLLNHPFFRGELVVSIQQRINLSVLVDLGASASFINDQFVELHGLTTHLLDSPFRICLFDGSSAVSGDVTHHIDG